MARIKSLVTKVEIDQAKKAHNCQRSSSHRINKGDSRLKVTTDGSPNHYCLDCARKIVEQDLAKLDELAKRLND